MMPRAIFAVLVVLCLSAPSCQDVGENNPSDPFPGKDPSTFTYRAYNSGDTLVVAGDVTLTRTDSSTITGTWVLEGIAATNRVGPQTGAGLLSGKLTGTGVSIDLNPGWADNNVILVGTVQGNKISGTWAWVTFIGPTTSGRFEAVRK